MTMQKRFTSKEAWRLVAYSLAMMSVFAPVHGAWRSTVTATAAVMVAITVASLVRRRCVC
jgi:hypothetical protein